MSQTWGFLGSPSTEGSGPPEQRRDLAWKMETSVGFCSLVPKTREAGDACLGCVSVGE